MPIPTPADRIPHQLAFLQEADRLKSVLRANTLADGSRLENAAEHSWHLCLWAQVFKDHSRGANLARVWQMLLLHDLSAIDTGGQSSLLPQYADERQRCEEAAVERLFALLPADQTVAFRTLWDEYRAGTSTDAGFAQMIAKAAPMFLALSNPSLTPTDRDVLHQIQTTGPFGHLKNDWPEIYALAHDMLHRRRPVVPATLAARMRFVMEADRLKAVQRGTFLCDGTRRENSAEHSWHIMLWAMTLQEHCAAPVRIDRVLAMLLLHDLVEIDAGDNPIHGQFDAAAVEAQEQAAATRIFGLLPPVEAAPLRAPWDEFEAAETSDAIFAKSLDRAQPLVSNLATGGGSWPDYNVTRDQIETRVAIKVKRGAPALWAVLQPQIDAWFAAHSTA